MSDETEENTVLDNGVEIDSEGNVIGGKIIRNTTSNTHFIYNIADKDGNIIGTTQFGKVKLVLHTVEGVKK